MTLTQADYAILVNDPTLAGWLSTWKGKPAVFTQDPPPDEAALPYILAGGEIAQTPFDTKDLQGREIFKDIRCYTAASGSEKLVEDIAERVRVLLHRVRVVVDGQPVLMSEVQGPRRGPAEKGAYSRILTHHVKTNPA